MHKKFEKLKLKSFGSIQKIINKKTKVLDKFGYVVAQIKIKHMNFLKSLSAFKYLSE